MLSWKMISRVGWDEVFCAFPSFLQLRVTLTEQCSLSEVWAADGRRFFSNFALSQFENTYRGKKHPLFYLFHFESFCMQTQFSISPPPLPNEVFGGGCTGMGRSWYLLRNFSPQSPYHTLPVLFTAHNSRSGRVGFLLKSVCVCKTYYVGMFKVTAVNGNLD